MVYMSPFWISGTIGDPASHFQYHRMLICSWYDLPSVFLLNQGADIPKDVGLGIWPPFISPLPTKQRCPHPSTVIFVLGVSEPWDNVRELTWLRPAVAPVCLRGLKWHHRVWRWWVVFTLPWQQHHSSSGRGEVDAYHTEKLFNRKK